jgi:hypothetical protein
VVGANYALTTLCGLCAGPCEWISLSILPSPILELQHAPLPLKVLWARERVRTPPSSIVFHLDSHLSPSRSWECASASKSQLSATWLCGTLKWVSPRDLGAASLSLLIWFWLKIWPFPFLEIMASCMVTSYEPQAAQVNEEPPPESSLDLTLTQHPRDEEPEPWEVRVRFEVEPPQAWYYCISPNSRTLVILLQVNPTSGDEPVTKLKILLSSHGL